MDMLAKWKYLDFELLVVNLFAVMVYGFIILKVIAAGEIESLPELNLNFKEVNKLHVRKTKRRYIRQIDYKNILAYLCNHQYHCRYSNLQLLYGVLSKFKLLGTHDNINHD